MVSPSGFVYECSRLDSTTLKCIVSDVEIGTWTAVINKTASLDDEEENEDFVEEDENEAEN